MAYTAPNDLFTSEEAILSLASSIADEDRTDLGNGTINGALDVLADALAERNVEVPPMNTGAILALAQYVSGGGGGGSVGALVDVPRVLYEQVEIGDNIETFTNQIDASRVKLGSDVIVEGEGAIMRIALGSTIETDYQTSAGTVTSLKLYDATLEPNAHGEMIDISSISEISDATNLETLEIGGDEIQRATINIPDTAPADSHVYVLEIIFAE